DFHVTGVQTCALPIWQDGLQFFRSNGPEAVGSYPDVRARQLRDDSAAGVDKARVAVRSVNETTLSVGRERSAESGMGVEHRKHQIGRASCRERGSIGG